MTIKLSEDQQQAVDAILRGENVFLTGEAGTGKSTVINHVRELLNMAMLAPTGLAALNIGGSTIHRFFGLSIGVQEPGSYKISKSRATVIKEAKTIALDEVSMVRVDLFSMIDEALRVTCESDEPFAGKQIICIGDFFQLPPIVKEPKQYDRTFNERLWLDENFGEGATYAFESKSWKAGNFSFQNLTTVHRQAGDKRFINALNKVRKGDADGLSYINKKAKKVATPNAVVLTSTNAKAEDANQISMCRLPEYKETKCKFKASVEGDFPSSEYPMTALIELCKDARVIFTANDSENEIPTYVNGDTGTIVKVAGSNMGIGSPNASIDVLKDDGKIVSVGLHKWEREEYTVKIEKGKKKLTKTVVGEFKQVPLKPAWAITAHKSQGQTMDKVHIDMPKTFADGQLYVALSRCKNLDTLSLSNDLSVSALKTSEKVIKFYDRRGGARRGAGRKASKWPEGTKLKVMRMPAEIEDEITEFAIKLLNQKSQ